MSSLYRLTAATLLEATPRKVMSASFSQPVVLSSTTLSIESFEAHSIPKISDIFDAPAKLRERKQPPRPLTSNIHSRARENGPRSRSIYDDALGLPWSLPPPVVFDGPACPPHMSPSALKKRRLQRQNLTPFPRGDLTSSTVSCGALIPQSQILCQLFDGPSRITRFQYPTSDNEWSSFKYVSFALCLSTAFGWLALKESLDQTRERSP